MRLFDGYGSEVRGCVEVEAAVLAPPPPSPSLIALMVSVDVKQH